MPRDRCFKRIRLRVWEEQESHRSTKSIVRRFYPMEIALVEPRGVTGTVIDDGWIFIYSRSFRRISLEIDLVMIFGNVLYYDYVYYCIISNAMFLATWSSENIFPHTNANMKDCRAKWVSVLSPSQVSQRRANTRFKGRLSWKNCFPKMGKSKALTLGQTCFSQSRKELACLHFLATHEFPKMGNKTKGFCRYIVKILSLPF